MDGTLLNKNIPQLDHASVDGPKPLHDVVTGQLASINVVTTSRTVFGNHYILTFNFGNFESNVWILDSGAGPNQPVPHVMVQVQPTEADRNQEAPLHAQGLGALNQATLQHAIQMHDASGEKSRIGELLHKVLKLGFRVYNWEMGTRDFDVKKLLNDRRFWFASFLIGWAAALQAYLMSSVSRDVDDLDINKKHFND
ncbi:hypothetical protein LXL04_012442 [Taraxacum kok-saghyz]